MTVDLCSSCKGLWCDEGELAALLGARDDHPLLAAARRAGATSPLRCPACEEAFLRSCPVGPDLRVALCPTCQGEWIDGGELPKLRAHLVAHAPPRPRTGPPPPPAPPSEASRIFSDRFEYDDPLVNGIAVPAALLLSLLLDVSGLRFFLSALVVNMWLHELGHAALAWFCGLHAVPLPFITFTFPEEKSALTSIALALILLTAIHFGRTRRRPYLVVLGALGLLLQAALTFFAPASRTGEWISFAGCAGELVWSTLLVISFYYRLPDRVRWDFFRYLALLFGAFGLVHAATQWYSVSRGLTPLPLGSALGGADDPGGDMNKLLSHGWTPGGVAGAYVRLAQACLALVAAHYAFFLRRALRKHRPAGGA